MEKIIIPMIFLSPFFMKKWNMSPGSRNSWARGPRGISSEEGIPLLSSPSFSDKVKYPGDEFKNPARDWIL
jgi:hypothetical protein